jgi:hypothetical protein
MVPSVSFKLGTTDLDIYLEETGKPKHLISFPELGIRKSLEYLRISLVPL